MQPNSTARAIVNKAIVSFGHIPIATDALYLTGIIDQFGNLNTQLDKYQQQCVTLLDIFHQALSLVMNKPFMFRKFIFQTAIGTTDYDVDNVIIEGLRANSFFNVTAGGLGNGLGVLTYEQYNTMYANPSNIPQGTPQFVVPLPDDGGLVTSMRVVPIPDQIYQIEGQCRFVVPPITKGSDRVAFPYRYEHPLIMKLVEVMETKLNEGREGTARTYAEQFVAEMIRDASGAVEETERQDLGFTLWGTGGPRRTTRDYNPSTDVVPPLP